MDRLDALESSNGTIVPVGTIISYMGKTAPSGYLVCDGSEYDETQYPNLAKYIKDEFESYSYFGDTSGATKFKVPNLQGEFLRGYSANSSNSVDSGVQTANIGKHQEATRSLNIYSWGNGSGTWHQSMPSNNVAGTWDIASETDKGIDWHYPKHIILDAVNYVYEPTNEEGFYTYYTSRPTNTSVLYCIKY